MPSLTGKDLLDMYANAPADPIQSVNGVMSGIIAEVTRRERRREKDLRLVRREVHAETPSSSSSLGVSAGDLSNPFHFSHLEMEMEMEVDLDDDIDIESMFGYRSKCAPLSGECTVCFEPFGNEHLTYCAAKCGNNFHKACIYLN